MKYTRGQFTQEYYQLWEMGLLLPVPKLASVFSVKYRKNHFDEYSKVTLKAVSVSDALERACYAITYASPWRPEDIDLHAVYDEEENLLWIDELFYEVVQKKNEFRGMERREFIAKFGMTTAAILFGLRSHEALAGTTVTFSGTATGVKSEQLYTTPGSYTWTVPAGVSSICVVCVGGGGGADSTAPVVTGVNGGVTTFDSTLVANGGIRGVSNSGGAGGAPSGATGGGTGGSGSIMGGGNYGGGGGAGGYSGNGGNGGTIGNTPAPQAGSGGGGGGGTWGPGGGVGLYGQGVNGTPGTTGGSGSAGGAGSGGSGSAYGGGALGGNGSGGGGGALAYLNSKSVVAGTGISVVVGSGGTGGYGSGGSGAVRIIWGAGRSFPSNAS